MAAPEIQIEGETLKLTGLLNVDTVAAYLEPGYQAIEKLPAIHVDLSEADIVGSAGVALLIAWQRRALQRDKDFSIENAPEHFLDMAKVSGVADILSFATTS